MIDPPIEYFAQASLDGQLVCGACNKLIQMPKDVEPGKLYCLVCKKQQTVTEDVARSANERGRIAYPQGRPGMMEYYKFKGGGDGFESFT